MAKSRITAASLIAAHDEIEKEIGFEPLLDTELPGDVFEETLYKGYVALKVTDEEFKGFSDATQETISALIEKYEDVKEAVKEPVKPKATETKKAARTKPTPVDSEVKEKAPKKFSAAEYNRIDALCDALKNTKKPGNLNEWVDAADEILKEKGGTTKPNTLATKFDAGYMYKLAKHFDLGELPPKK